MHDTYQITGLTATASKLQKNYSEQRPEDFGLESVKNKVLRGPYCETMAELTTNGFTPFPPERYFNLRTNSLGQTHQDKVWEAVFHTPFAISVTPEAVYLDTDPKRVVETILRVAGTGLIDYGIPSQDTPNIRKYRRGEVILGRDLSEREAKTNPLWLNLFAGDRDKLGSYVENTFKLGRDQYGFETMMGIYPGENGLWRVLTLDGLVDWSRISGEPNPRVSPAYLLAEQLEGKLELKEPEVIRQRLD